MTNMLKKQNGSRPSNLGSVIDEFFPRDLSRLFNDSLWGFGGLTGLTNVPVNIWQTDNTYEMEVVAPGLKKEDFKISLDGKALTVSFEEKEEEQEEKKTWITQEFRRKSLSRTFTVDDTIDLANIKARYEDGVLHLTLPIHEQAKNATREISIQ